MKGTQKRVNEKKDVISSFLKGMVFDNPCHKKLFIFKSHFSEHSDFRAILLNLRSTSIIKPLYFSTQS